MGAHVGLVSLQVAARRVGVGVAVHAFEPSSINAARFRRNVELNAIQDVTLNQVAVGDREGEAELAWDAAGTDYAGSRLTESGRFSDGSGVERVRTILLDRYAEERAIERVDVLKLDVEGSETSAIDGASSLLAAGRVGCVICELNDVYLAQRGLERADLAASLGGFGYRPVAIPPVGAQRVRVGRRAGAVVDAAFVRNGTA